MRRSFATLGLTAGLLAASPSSAFEETRNGHEALRALRAPELLAPAAPRGGRRIAAFTVDERTVTLSAYGRRARARAIGNIEDVHHARVMGKVFDGAPQPALLTLEVSLKF